MPDPKTEEVQAWLNKAQHDLDAAAWLLESPRPLSPYAVITRYTGDIPDISITDAQDAFTLAQTSYQFILAKLPDRFTNSPLDQEPP